MDAQMQIQIFKQEAVRWLNNQLSDLLGDGFTGKLLRPLADSMISKYADDPNVDKFLSIFIDSEGKFNIDDLLNKYIDIFTTEGGIKFRWGDVTPMGAMLDKLNGGNVNIITASDIKSLKDAFMAKVTLK